MNDYNAIMNTITRFSKRYPIEFLEALMYAPFLSEALLADHEEMKKIMQKIQERLNTNSTIPAYYEIELTEDVERHWWLPKVNMTSHGVTT